MEIKKSKCTKFEPMEPMGKANPANVTFENGEKHFTFSKFEVGQEYEYYIETRKKKSGDGTYEVCCKKKEEGGYGGAKGSWNTKAKCISMGMSYSKDLLLNPIIGQLGLTKIHEVIIPAMLNKWDTDNKDEKDFVMSAMSYAKDCVLNAEVRKNMLEPFGIKEVTGVSLLEMTTRLFDGMFKAMKGYL